MHILMLSVLDSITNLFVHFLVCTIKTYHFVYIILSYVFLHLHTIPMYASIIFHSWSMIFKGANFWHFVNLLGHLFSIIVHLYKCCAFFSYTSVIHDLCVLDLHFNSPFAYIDNQDFLRENGEVSLVLGIRERP